MKKTIHKTKPVYATFVGEFSQQWVGVRTVNGQVTHSVQRASKLSAELAVQAVDIPGGQHDVVRFI